MSKTGWDVREEYAKSMADLLVATRQYTESLPQKLRAMHEIYVRKNSAVYDNAEVLRLRHYLDLVIYKFALSTLSLEQLWALGNSNRVTVLDAIENGLDRLECSNDELMLSSFALENFLFQSNSMLDIYMLFLCFVLRTGHDGKMSSKEQFYKELTKISKSPFLEKANTIRIHFESRIFSDNQDGFPRNDWGKLLRNLRDRIAHRDRIRPNFESKETLMSGVLLDWPTLQGLTYDRFGQEIQNGMFYMLTEIASAIYGLEWKPGPYKADLWEEVK